MDLFDYMREQNMEKEAPLASRLRPTTLEEVVGQQHIIGKDKLLYRAIKADKLSSVIFYGPPGTGKTTLAKVIANTTSAEFTQINATTAGKKDMEEVINKAKEMQGMYRKKTILFVDEIHRLNKIYRQKDRATDVLSFPLGQDGHYDTNKETGCALLGDVVISLEMAVKQADMYGHSLEREIGFLTVHSMLHLLGYDHETSPLEERKMREKEEEVLGELGISREATFTNQPEDTDA